MYLHISICNGSATMGKTLRLGILREIRNPSDRRVPLTLPQIIALYPDVEFFVHPSDYRCYSNEKCEYLDSPFKEYLHKHKMFRKMARLHPLFKSNPKPDYI
jgi:hypothetical protein